MVFVETIVQMKMEMWNYIMKKKILFVCQVVQKNIFMKKIQKCAKNVQKEISMKIRMEIVLQDVQIQKMDIFILMNKTINVWISVQLILYKIMYVSILAMEIILIFMIIIVLMHAQFLGIIMTVELKVIKLVYHLVQMIFLIIKK